MRTRSPVFPVLLVNFIGTLGFSIVLPFLVFMVTRLGGNALVYGLVGATCPAFQLLGAPLLASHYSRAPRRERWTRKTLLVLIRGGGFRAATGSCCRRWG